MKNFKNLLVLLLAAAAFQVIAAGGAYAIEAPGVTARSVVIADTKTGAVLYSHNEGERIEPASITKIMTVLLAAEAIESGSVFPGDIVTASENLNNGMDEDSSTANIKAGESMSLINLMYCAMLGSANEACNIIAEYISGSIDAFVERMNERALELGCTGTHFANAHGMPDKNHYTTALDLYLIALEAKSNSLFADICGTGYIEIPQTNVSETRRLVNTNMLLNASSEFYYEYASGIKTGYTGAAGNCLVSTAEKGDISLLAVVMGSSSIKDSNGNDSPRHFADTITLYDWAFSNFSYREVLRSTEIVSEIPVDLASDTDHISLRPESTVQILLSNDDNLDLFKNEIVIYSERDGVTLTAPIAAGEVLGEVSVVYNGLVYGSSKLVAANSVDLSRLQYIGSEIEKTWKKPIVQVVFWIIVLLVVGYIVLVVRYYTLRFKHRRSVRAAKELRMRHGAGPENRQDRPQRRIPEASSFVDYRMDEREYAKSEMEIEDEGEDFPFQDFSDWQPPESETPGQDGKLHSARGFFEDFFSK